MNRTLTLTVITAITAIMGTSIVAPALADHGEPVLQLCLIGDIYDPNTISCIPEDSCPNGIGRDGEFGERHCLLDWNINDDKKLTICHQSKGNSNPVTIEVSANSVEKHLAHGDTLGECVHMTPD